MAPYVLALTSSIGSNSSFHRKRRLTAAHVHEGVDDHGYRGQSPNDCCRCAFLAHNFGFSHGTTGRCQSRDEYYGHDRVRDRRKIRPKTPAGAHAGLGTVRHDDDDDDFFFVFVWGKRVNLIKSLPM